MATKKTAVNKCLGCKNYQIEYDTCDTKKEGEPVVYHPNTYFKKCSNWKQFNLYRQQK